MATLQDPAEQAGLPGLSHRGMQLPFVKSSQTNPVRHVETPASDKNGQACRQRNAIEGPVLGLVPPGEVEKM